jgi:hypothetical protein
MSKFDTNLRNPSFFKNNLKKIKALRQMPKGWKVKAPLTFSSYNQIIEELQKFYKLKELIDFPVSAINNV